MATSKPTSVDEYISQASPEAQYILFVYAAAKHHVSLHPTLEVITVFKDQLKEYETSENTVKFSLDEELPLTLISRMAKQRVAESKQGVKWK